MNLILDIPQRFPQKSFEELQYMVDNLDNLFIDSSNEICSVTDYFKIVTPNKDGSMLEQLKFYYQIKLREKNIDELLNE